MTTRRKSSSHTSSTAPIIPPDTTNVQEETIAEQYYTMSPATERPLQGKIALVTGATGGIGKAVSRRLAMLGCSVGVHYNTDQDAALELREELKENYTHAHGSKFVIYGGDLSNYDEVR